MVFLKSLNVSTIKFYLDIFISTRIFKAATKTIHILQWWLLYAFVQIHKTHNALSEVKCKHWILIDDAFHH